MQSSFSSSHLAGRARYKAEVSRLAEPRDQDIPPTKEFVLSGENSQLSYNFTWIRGRRPTMEDSHLAQRLDANLCMFGIFDGHGGSQVSRLLPELLAKDFKNSVKSVKSASGSYSKEDVANCLRNSFRAVDKELYKRLQGDCQLCGSTAAVVVVHKDFLVAAHCGDTKIHVYHQPQKSDNVNKILYDSNDHKPSRSSEKSRICANGGAVFLNRISTREISLGLSVSRSFGDFIYKSDFDQRHLNVLTVEPEMFSLDLRDQDISGIAIVCDGVTDVINCERLRSLFQESCGSSGELVRAAYKDGSLDNISAGCLLFSQRPKD